MKVLVLGATGFLGRTVCRRLTRRGIDPLRASLSLGTDLREREQVRTLLGDMRPDFILNCASFVGGIQFGYRFPAEMFTHNLRMTVNLLEACHEFGVRRLVNPISNCAYPARASLFREDEFWEGPLHESVMVYGFVRKASWVGSWAFAREYGLDVLNLILSNMYGPGDHFEEERSHALGALVMKFVRARRSGEPAVTVWGSGTPVREWLYVEDGAEAMIRGLDAPACLDPVNIGVASGVSIAELAEMIREIAGYRGEIRYDPTKPDGAPHKTVDGRRGEALLGWKPVTDLQEGIRATVAAYEASLDATKGKGQ